METNYEHYQKEIAEQVSCIFRKTYFFKSNICGGVQSCKECHELILKWLNQNYVPKSDEVFNWDQVPKDTPVLVWENNDNGIPHAKKRFFAAYLPAEKEQRFATYANGASSWSHEGKYEEWSNCSLFLVEDMEKYMKKD